MPALQIRRYCWNAGLPVGIVTDFEEWAIYDGRFAPVETDTPEVARIAYFSYLELEERWPWIHDTFSKNAVAYGSLDRLVGDIAGGQELKTIDKSFLAEIRDWRQKLAVGIYDRNAELDSSALNLSVQSLINRLIFLRIAEARGLERMGVLQEIAAEGPNIYDRLKEVFLRADRRYNSGLFNFSDESDASRRSAIDSLSLSLTIPDDCLDYIIRRLYYPYPYEFSIIPADILGRVYEQFLGEEILVTNGTVRTDLKASTRRSGGIYYTPPEIVEYIVDRTIAPLLSSAPLITVKSYKFLDPACGSGSFLIIVFQRLIEWFTDYYASRPTLSLKFLERRKSDSTLRLKTDERKRILLSMIYGVDLDQQAVEVSKLSLLLKVIEGQEQLMLDVGHILPDLSQNIKCGNSLFSHWEDTEQHQTAYNDIRPFDWNSEFPTILQEGGFAAIVGNPPYFSVDATWGAGDERLSYLRDNYPEVYTDKTDILFYFLKKSIDLCKGEIGMIVSRSFLEAFKARNLRTWIGSQISIREILDFRESLVFDGVGINTAIIRFSKSTAVGQAVFRRYQEKELPKGYRSAFLSDGRNTQNVAISQEMFGPESWNFGADQDRPILNHIDSVGTPVGDILHIGQGMQTGANKSFAIELCQTQAQQLIEDGHVKMRARNSDIQRFFISPSGVYLIFPYAVRSFADLPEPLRTHLSSCKDILKKRAAYKRGNCEWWRYTWPLHLDYANRPRIYCPYRAKHNRFAVDSESRFLGITDTTVLYDDGQEEDLRYLAALLSSALLTYRHSFIAKLCGGGVFEYFENTVSQLPIIRSRPGDDFHDKIVDLYSLAEVEISKRNSSMVISEQSECEHRVSEISNTIDQLVFTQYGISPDDADYIRRRVALGG